MHKLPLKTQFTIAFVLILLLSVAATITTYFSAFVIYTRIENKNIYPANYFEKRIPEIEEYIQKEGVKLLNSEEKGALEKIIPTTGAAYQVIDPDGNPVYGNENRKVIENKPQFYKQLNTTFTINGHFAKLVPLINNDQIAGGVLLLYALSPTYASFSDKLWIAPLSIFILFSPFLYVIIFTLLFSKYLVGNINKPLKMLIQASKKVKEKDLNFTIDYKASNELGKLCEAFNDMKEELEISLLTNWRMEQERLELIENLAHDIKTPLTIIQGYAESLLNENMDVKLINYLTIIKENARRSSNYVQQMQYAADLEKSNSFLNYSSIDVIEFVKKKVENYTLLSKQKGIEIVYNITDARPYEINCLIDPEKLERILDNIVLNSTRFTPIGGKIHINARLENKMIYFTVCDSGIGFSIKDLSHVFIKLYRGNEARSGKDGHSGLGLYIAKQLVEQHGGTIRAYNSAKGGACVKFNISCQD